MNGSSHPLRRIRLFVLTIGLAAGLQACTTAAVSPIEESNGFDTLSSLQQGQYVLQSGDQIYIQVFNDPDLTMEATVAQSGSINYSYLGPIEVAGQTAEQLADSITSKLRDGYLKDPSVNVTIQRYGSFFIDGEVSRPGSYPFEPGLTLAKAVSLAGGMTDRASDRKMVLSREVDGARKSVNVNLSQRVQPGDVITIGEGVF